MPNSMDVVTTPGALKKSGRTPWRFQQTIELPSMSDRDRFVSTIIAALEDFGSMAVTIDEVVFNTERMSAVCPAGSALSRDATIFARSTEDAQALLLAAFWDGVDFIGIPTPKPFVFYADHDDWVTFYANSKSNLNRVIEPLASHGFKMVRDWQRELR